MLAATMGEAATWSKPSVVRGHHAVWIRDSRGGHSANTKRFRCEKSEGDGYTGGGTVTGLGLQYSTVHL